LPANAGMHNVPARLIEQLEHSVDVGLESDLRECGLTRAEINNSRWAENGLADLVRLKPLDSADEPILHDAVLKEK
jgi:hypothetical protein